LSELCIDPLSVQLDGLMSLTHTDFTESWD